MTAPEGRPSSVRNFVLGAGAVGAVLLWHGLRERPPPSEGAPPVVRASGSADVRLPPEVPGEISVRSLLREMVDLSALARLPNPSYVARAASSYDRRSVTPDGKPDGWFANDDWASAARPNYLRVEERDGRREYVLMDEKGPGVLVRIWSASPAGTLRLYFDGESKPEIDVPFESLLTAKGPIPEPFAYVAAKGFNAYFPIPFQKGLKVTIDSLVLKNPWKEGTIDRIYYHLSYRSYPGEVAPRVRSYRRAELRAMLADAAETARVFREPWLAAGASPGAKSIRMTSEGGELRSTVDRPGGGALREIALLVRDTSDKALSQASVSLRFDGQTTVETPLVDFFGTAPGLAPYDSLPFTLRADGSLVCRFTMPFRERAEVTVRGSPGAQGTLLVDALPFTSESLYFFARRRPAAVVQSQPSSDLRMISIEGQGVYVGDVFDIQNPNDRWWGEGDEKIYVDGETFPSFFGTGTEDYYGYAWSTGEAFSRALHAQTRAGGPGFSGTFSMNRFRTLDAIPFDQSLRFDMELWHWGKTQVTWQSSMYYYARPGAKDDLMASRN